MRKVVIALLSVLASCYSVPEETDFVLNISSDYKSVADCAWLTFRTKDGWTKDDLDSMNRVEFSFGNSTSTAGRIDVIGTGPGKTRVESHMPRAVWGKDFWPSRLKPSFEACAK